MEPDKDIDNLAGEPVAEYSRLDLNRIYTYWDYLRWTFSERVELIRGKVVKMSPGPAPDHQRMLGSVNRQFDKYFVNRPCELFFAPFDVRLPVPSAQKDSTVVQPDIVVICDPAKIDTRGCNGAPDLVLEILSPGNAMHDMAVKFQLYEESGVKEYWIVQREPRAVLIYYLENGRYLGLPPCVEGMMAKGKLFPELQVDVSSIYLGIPVAAL